jgi:hypothetical protein
MFHEAREVSVRKEVSIRACRTVVSVLHCTSKALGICLAHVLCVVAYSAGFVISSVDPCLGN